MTLALKFIATYVMCFILSRDVRGISTLRKMRNNEKIAIKNRENDILTGEIKLFTLIAKSKLFCPFL